MPKLKTRKAVAKRFKITAKKKVLHRMSGQNHFNSKEPSKITLKKRRDKELTGKLAKNVLKEIVD